MKKIMTVTMAAAASLALAAGPAAAHVNAKAGPTAPNTPASFIGPALDGSNNGAIAHNGIECAAARNPNIGSIPAFSCPGN